MGSAIKCFSSNRRQRNKSNSEVIETRKTFSPIRPNSTVVVASSYYKDGNSPTRERANPFYVLDMKGINIESEFQPQIVESIFKIETDRKSEELGKTEESESHKIHNQSRFILNKITLEESNVLFEEVPSTLVSKIQITSDQEIKDLFATENIFKEESPLKERQNANKVDNIQKLNHYFGEENNFGTKTVKSARNSVTNLSHKESPTNKLDVSENHNTVDKNEEELYRQKGFKKTFIDFSDEEDSNIEKSKNQVENSKKETGCLSSILKNHNSKIINANEEHMENKVNSLILKFNNEALSLQAMQDELEKEIENKI